jgi:hypothetical protein
MSPWLGQSHFSLSVSASEISPIEIKKKGSDQDVKQLTYQPVKISNNRFKYLEGIVRHTISI